MRLHLTSCRILNNRQDACSTKNKFSCGMGILPVRERLVKNGARYQLHRNYTVLSPLARLASRDSNAQNDRSNANRKDIKR
ncbi:MAG: hypothetical protein EAZ49_00735 [Oscillatoriales cyanobacterium]|nr:MAG: hypothetical protein EAZ49_00735 [Oscillatoriales cyanobacterium]